MLSGVAKAASRCCELANPAHVRQIASQTGDLLRQMRFVAGRGAIAKRMAALWQRAVGKMLLAKAQWRSCWYGQPAEAAGQGHCGREPSGIRSWPGRRGGDAGKSTIRKTQLARPPLRSTIGKRMIAEVALRRTIGKRQLAGPPQGVQKAEWLTAV